MHMLTWVYYSSSKLVHASSMSLYVVPKSFPRINFHICTPSPINVDSRNKNCRFYVVATFMATYNLVVSLLYKNTSSADRINSPSSSEVIVFRVHPDVFSGVAKGFLRLPFTSVRRSSVFNTLRIISFLSAFSFPFSVSLLAFRVSLVTDVVLRYEVWSTSWIFARHRFK